MSLTMPAENHDGFSTENPLARRSIGYHSKKYTE
jgi:hypothetical protein